MKKYGRVYIYTSLTLIFVTYNYIFEMVFNTIQEAIFESLVIAPMILLFLYIIYWTRKFTLNIKTVQDFTTKSTLNKNTFIVGLIAVKALLITVISKYVTDIFFSTTTSLHFFDILFFTLLISVLVIMIFIYFFEDYVTSINEKHDAVLELTNHKLEKSYIKYLSLKRQLNPHFLFNSFNSLMALIPSDQLKAEKFLAELSKIYRYNLAQNDNLVVMISEELEMIQSYIYLQKIRFGDALKYQQSVEVDSEKLLIPPMTLQLLIENALKHNIINKANPLCIDLTILEDKVIVKNDFQPRDSESKLESFGIGLDSIKNQLELITDKALNISIQNKTYIVEVPLIKTEIDD